MFGCRLGYHRYVPLANFGGVFCRECSRVWDAFGNEWR